MSRVAATYPEEAGFIALPADDAEDSDDVSWSEFYLQAWSSLRYDRVYGAFGGELPISYAAVSHYARDNAIAGEDLMLFRSLLSVLDDEWLGHVAEKQKQKQTRRPPS